MPKGAVSESAWDRAKKIVEKQYGGSIPKERWGLVTYIAQKIDGKKSEEEGTEKSFNDYFLEILNDRSK